MGRGCPLPGVWRGGCAVAVTLLTFDNSWKCFSFRSEQLFTGSSYRNPLLCQRAELNAATPILSMSTAIIIKLITRTFQTSQAPKHPVVLTTTIRGRSIHFKRWISAPFMSAATNCRLRWTHAGFSLCSWIKQAPFIDNSNGRRLVRSSPIQHSCRPFRCAHHHKPGQVVHTHVPLFTKQYKLVPAQNRHSTRHTSPVSMDLQLLLVSG